MSVVPPVLAMLGCFAALCANAHGALWLDATEVTIGTTGEWSNKVTLADVDGDGLIDILIANGGNYNSAGEPQANRAFINRGPGLPLEDLSVRVFGQGGDLARSIKAADLNADGVMDLIVATTYETRSRLYLGLGAGHFLELSDTHVPPTPRSFGDVEVGDVDGDGDLDLVFADWGNGAPQSNSGAPPRLWLNNGEGSFTDATDSRIPFTPIRWSWDLELVDVDNDFDLDIAVSCKSCERQFLFENDGEGYFDNAHDKLPASSNNYELAPMDFDGDGWIDMATVNDGPDLDEGLLVNDGAGNFERASEAIFSASVNVGEDDNVIEWNDIDSDGDPDMLIGSLSGADRILLNQDGVLALQDSDVLAGGPSPGTLGIAFGDLDGDGRADVVMAQGEVDTPERVFLGDQIEPDTHGPWIGPLSVRLAPGSPVETQLRVHDRQSPGGPHDLTEVVLLWRHEGGEETAEPMSWFGEYLWRTTAEPLFDGAVELRVCATDRAQNRQCGEARTVSVEGFGPPPMPEAEPEPDQELQAAEELAETDAAKAADGAPATSTEPGAATGCSSAWARTPLPVWAGLMCLAALWCVRRRP